MRASEPRVALLTGLGFFRLFGMEGMGGMATVTLELDVVAPVAECLLERFREGLVLGMTLDAVPGDRMSSSLELIEFLPVAPATGLRLDRRFFGFGLLVTFMTGDTIDLLLRMLAVDPRLKNPPSFFLMAGKTLPDLFL